MGHECIAYLLDDISATLSIVVVIAVGHLPGLLVGVVILRGVLPLVAGFEVGASATSSTEASASPVKPSSTTAAASTSGVSTGELLGSDFDTELFQLLAVLVNV